MCEHLGWAALPCCVCDTCNCTGSPGGAEQQCRAQQKLMVGLGNASVLTPTPPHISAGPESQPSSKAPWIISLHFPGVLQPYKKDWGTRKWPNLKFRNHIWVLLHRKESLCFCGFCLIVGEEEALGSVRFTVLNSFWGSQEGLGTFFPQQAAKEKGVFSALLKCAQPLLILKFSILSAFNYWHNVTWLICCCLEKVQVSFQLPRSTWNN